MTSLTLFGHALWIGGLAWLLAIFGWRSWRDSQPNAAPVGAGWAWRAAGLCMTTTGLLLISQSPLQAGLWATVTAALLAWLARAGWRAYRRFAPPQLGQERPGLPSLARRVWVAPATRWGIGTLVSVVALYLAFRKVDYSEVATSLLHANVAFITLALISVALNTVVKGIRWRVLMGKPGRPIPLLEVLRVLLISQMLNTIIPARVGELSRAYMLGRQGPGPAFVLGTVALEKLLDIILYVILFLFLVLLMPVPAWVSQPIYPFAIVSISSLATIVLMSRYQRELLGLLTHLLRWLPARLRERITRLVGSALTSLSILKDWRSSLKVGWWSAIIWITAVLNNYLVLQALGIEAPPPAALLVLIVLQAGIAIPSVPGKIGVFQYLCILALDAFAIDRTLSLSYGVLLQAIVFLPTTALGVILLWVSGVSVRRTVLAGLGDAAEPLPSAAVDR